jgi:tRNA pseudouridine38-40 synthase
VDRNYRMELQYDGTRLHGWARQEGLPTVEGCLKAALATVLGSAPALHVAGRTDAGVHARRQVVSLLLPAGIEPARLIRSLNALTPPGIAVTRIVRAPARFDARKDAVSRTYRYFLTNDEVVSPFWAPYCWQVPGAVDPQALWGAAVLVAGRHDFRAFTPAQTEHVFFERLVLRCAWKKMREGLPAGAPLLGTTPPNGVPRSGAGPSAGAAQSNGLDRQAAGATDRAPGSGSNAPAQALGGLVYLQIEAEAYLRHMVRTLVGTMIEVARGERSLEAFARLLEGAPREGSGPTAPAQGLFLWDVRYGATRGG